MCFLTLAAVHPDADAYRVKSVRMINWYKVVFPTLQYYEVGALPAISGVGLPQ